MITELLLDAIDAVIRFVLAPFPDSDAGAIAGHLETIASNLGALNYFLPIAETFALVLGVLFVFPLLMGITLSMWILAQLRGSSSRG